MFFLHHPSYSASVECRARGQKSATLPHVEPERHRPPGWGTRHPAGAGGGHLAAQLICHRAKQICRQITEREKLLGSEGQEMESHYAPPWSFTGRTRCHKSFLSPATSLLILVPFSSSEAFHGLAFELTISHGPSTHTPALTLRPCRPLPIFPVVGLGR